MRLKDSERMATPPPLLLPLGLILSFKGWYLGISRTPSGSITTNSTKIRRYRFVREKPVSLGHGYQFLTNNFYNKIEVNSLQKLIQRLSHVTIHGVLCIPGAIIALTILFLIIHSGT